MKVFASYALVRLMKTLPINKGCSNLDEIITLLQPSNGCLNALLPIFIRGNLGTSKIDCGDKICLLEAMFAYFLKREIEYLLLTTWYITASS